MYTEAQPYSGDKRGSDGHVFVSRARDGVPTVMYLFFYKYDFVLPQDVGRSSFYRIFDGFVFSMCVGS